MKATIMPEGFELLGFSEEEKKEFVKLRETVFHYDYATYGMHDAVKKAGKELKEKFIRPFYQMEVSREIYEKFCILINCLPPCYERRQARDYQIELEEMLGIKF